VYAIALLMWRADHGLPHVSVHTGPVCDDVSCPAFAASYPPSNENGLRSDVPVRGNLEVVVVSQPAEKRRHDWIDPFLRDYFRLQSMHGFD
jgi:hypothetical protein